MSRIHRIILENTFFYEAEESIIPEQTPEDYGKHHEKLRTDEEENYKKNTKKYPIPDLSELPKLQPRSITESSINGFLKQALENSKYKPDQTKIINKFSPNAEAAHSQTKAGVATMSHDLAHTKSKTELETGSKQLTAQERLEHSRKVGTYGK